MQGYARADPSPCPAHQKLNKLLENNGREYLSLLTVKHIQLRSVLPRPIKIRQRRASQSLMRRQIVRTPTLEEKKKLNTIKSGGPWKWRTPGGILDEKSKGPWSTGGLLVE